MKKATVILGMLLLIIGQASAKNLQAHLAYATFYSPEEGPYIETYLSINPNSIRYEETVDGKFKGAVEITLIFKQEEKVSAFDKYVLNSPVLEDTTDISDQFIDLKRFVLPKGEYYFTISISDQNSSREPYIASEKVDLEFHENQIQFSDIQMVDNYKKSENQNILTKSGYDLIPYPSSFYPENKKDLIFYSELYNTEKLLGKDSRFLLKFYLRSANTHQPLKDYVKIRRMESKPVHTIFHKFDLSEIPSGNYDLIMEVYDEKNQLIANKGAYIQRSNPSISTQQFELTAFDENSNFAGEYSDKEVLMEKIRGLAPIADKSEVVFINGDLKSYTLEELQKFLYYFWAERNKLDPEQAWKNYEKNLATVNSEFKTMVKEGYETDRGQVFLRYGAPNAIARSYNEPKAYPFEVWQYYETENHRDSKFVFYSRDMVNNDFELLHSNVPGEVKNRKWQFIIFERGIKDGSVDDVNAIDAWGSKLEYYDNPY